MQYGKATRTKWQNYQTWKEKQDIQEEAHQEEDENKKVLAQEKEEGQEEESTTNSKRHKWGGCDLSSNMHYDELTKSREWRRRVVPNLDCNNNALAARQEEGSS